MLKLRNKNPRAALTAEGMTEDWSFDMTQYKTCSICKQLQSIDSFGYNNKAKGYFKSQCKSCDTKRMKVYNAKNKNQIIENKRNYYLKNQDDLLLKRKIYRLNNHNKVTDGYAIWLEKNRDVVRANAKNRKARLKAAKSFLVTSRDVRKILRNPCIYCGSNENIQLEHVIPLARGGSHSIGNLASACAACNMSKNKWFVTEWKSKQKKWGASF
jgi:5-methylcytosine-specific restriction endonuclease McrA